MAHQHVFLVQDESFELSYLKGRKKRVQQLSSGSNGVGMGQLAAKIVDFAHPRTGESFLYSSRSGGLRAAQRADTGGR